MKQYPKPTQLGLDALTVVFGMQTLRSLLPLLAFLLRDRFGWSSALLGALGLGLFLASFSVPGLRRRLGPRRLLMAAAVALGLARLGLQIWTGDPVGELLLAMVATVLFLVVLATRSADARSGGAPAAVSFGQGVLAGLLLDTALHGAFGTYDMSWRGGLVALLVSLGLAAAYFPCLAGAAKETPRAVDGSRAGSTAVLGPFLFLQMVVFQNVARTTALTGWSQEGAFSWVLLAQVLGLAAAAVVAARVGTAWHRTLALAIPAVAALSIPWPTGAPAALLLAAGQVLTAALLLTALAGLGAGGRGARADGHGLGMVALMALLFLYYAGFDLALPVSRDLVPPLAALAVGVAAVRAARAASRRAVEAPAAAGWRLVAVALPLLLLPLMAAVRTSEVVPRSAGGFPIRVMTYNLHCGFDVHGHLGLEALARSIEAENPDVVGLQEVSRGWVINGAVDMVTWLSRRLDMPYVFAPTADPLWGNAVLARRRILGHTALGLPPRDLVIRRGLLAVTVEVGPDERLEVTTTHFHHRRSGGDSRVVQSRALLDFWRGRPRTLLLGDFNATPGSPEIELLRAAGFADVIDLAGLEPGYTAPSRRPWKRIDYIWLSPDLGATDVVISPATASDHLAVAATIDLGRGSPPM